MQVQILPRSHFELNMKTAEEWNKQLDSKMGIEEREQDVERIKQIQLDAMKEGMRRAAKMHELGDSVHSMEETILSAAEQLTEKDL